MKATAESGVTPLADRIRAAADADEIQIPPLPELAIRLRDTLQSDDADARQVAELVQTDPALVASLLRVANSAAFGGLRKITDLNQAIARLGMKQVEALVTGLLIKDHFNGDSDGSRSDLLHLLWNHSVAVGFAARRLAQKVDADPSEAFLAGLLHDCGRLFVLRAVSWLEEQEAGLQVTDPVVLELMTVLHCELGHLTLTNWNLPEPICNVALHHEDDPDGVDDDDALLRCVQAADLISQKLAAHLEPEPELTLLEEPAIELLGLGDLEVAALLVDLEDEMEEVQRLF